MQLYNSSVSLGTKALFRFVSVPLVVFSTIFLTKTASAPVVFAEIANVASVPKNVLPSSGRPDIDRFIVSSATRHGVDPLLVHCVIRQESNYRLNARSGKNAQGLMQMIPATAERFGVENTYDPKQNIEGGVKYLRWLLREFDGDVRLALAGYNAGEGAVKRNGNRVPDYKETKNYVQKITAAYGKTRHPVLSPEEAKQEFAAVAAE